MNQESENLGELLNNEFFLSFEIEELNEENLLSEEVFNEIFSIDNPIKRTQLIAKMRKQAQKLKILKDFNEMVKLYKSGTFNKTTESSNEFINFTNVPLKNLKCGNWNCSDNGVSKLVTINNVPTLVIACCHPIIPTERLINIDTNTEKIRLSFYKDYKWKDIVVNKNSISTKSKIIQLADRGIDVNDNNAKELITYLSDILILNQDKIPVSQGITHLGWVENDFVPYTGKYIYDGDSTYKSKFESVSAKGDYKLWKSEIKKLRDKNTSLKFLISASFASPLLKLFNINSFIVHLWGRSGNGKTVAEMVCASVWGNPKLGKYLSTLDSTRVAQERQCDFLRNLPLILDELQLSKTRYSNFDTLVYALTESKGKDRGTVDGGITASTEWNNISITSGEEPLTKDSSKEGVKNRVIEIEDNDKIVEDGNSIVNLILSNYGFAGKDFIDKIQTMENLEDKFNAEVTKLKSKLKDISTLKQVNAIAIITMTDKIVSKFIFEDEPIQDEQLQGFFTKDVDEADRYINIILDAANANIDQFYGIKDIINGKKWGKVKKSSDGNGKVMYYEFIPGVLYELLNNNGIDWNGCKKKLADKGYVERDSQGKFTCTSSFPNGNQRIIRIKNIYF